MISLFPTMPFQNHPIANPYIKNLCEKHGINYRVITWWEAIAKIQELRHPGYIWLQEFKNASHKV